MGKFLIGVWVFVVIIGLHTVAVSQANEYSTDISYWSGHHTQSTSYKPTKVIHRKLNVSKVFHPVIFGEASWYGLGDGYNGQRTASGRTFNTYSVAMCAMLHVPLYTWVTVKNLNNGLMIRCQVLDRGPYVRGRVIDLSYAAKNTLRMGGTAPIAIAIER